MTRMIFVNLPVRDVQASRAFYTSLGFTINERFSDETVACVVVSESIFVMVMERSRFEGFSLNPISPAGTTEVLNCLSCESREEVDQLVTKALDNGGATWKPAMDMDFMYGGSFQDPDGHAWELNWMDPAALHGDAAPEAATA
ncbi:glyoxalase [Conexibacter sp. W3-3-2]|uniref:VOC family protein n=1 Tax=Conexibacter sp. W3-3-2 TaxID=2675227 RepID=UPI0012B9D396|nr:VOC family protein [Conexibacter sp. W3-3-2]MTD45518.1 glyoxalase [Conexibacter sp. W3-3-2]